MTRLGIPIQEPEQSELTEQGESGTTWEVWEGWKGRTSSSEELGTLSLTLTAPSSPAGSYSGINLEENENVLGFLYKVLTTADKELQEIRGF